MGIESPSVREPRERRVEVKDGNLCSQEASHHSEGVIYRVHLGAS